MGSTANAVEEDATDVVVPGGDTADWPLGVKRGTGTVGTFNLGAGRGRLIILSARRACYIVSSRALLQWP